MPKTKKGKKIKAAMEKSYGKKKGKAVFYASINKGRISGTGTDTEARRKSKRSKRTAKRRSTKR